MGTIESKSLNHSQAYQLFGDIYLHLENNRKSYFPGELVRGTVYLNLKKEYPGHSIYLELKGEETISSPKIDQQIPVEEGSPTRERSPTREKSRKDIIIRTDDMFKTICKHLNATLTVYEFPENKIPAGQYAFPFEFTLPHKLPASYFFAKQQLLAEVKYKIHTYIEPALQNEGQQPKLKHKHKIIILDPPLVYDESKLATSEIGKLSCCCLLKGKLSLRLVMQKRSFLLG